MPVPVSIEAQFRRLNKMLRDLQRADTDTTKEDRSILVADICNSCILTLDKTMNDIWNSKSKKEGKGKPNIYFPVATTSKEKFLQKLDAYQMKNLENNDPELFGIIESAQAYSGNKWLPEIYKIAQIRHHAFPAINEAIRTGIGLGRGQGVYIEYMTTDENGNINLRGHGINKQSGMIEPMRIDFIHETISILEGLNQEPFQFCSSSVAKIKRLVSDIYRSLGSKD